METKVDVEPPELGPEYDALPVYVVGGWVRDTLRGKDPSDVDLLVAETTPQEMLNLGFKHIDSPNNDTFPVFLDSEGREVAIAREEKSTGDGHTDFEVDTVPPQVEAKEAVRRDLERRDFTINAMAMDARWKHLIDPFGGQAALTNGRIRHVSEAFREDPLRILRGARFAARFGYDIVSETRILMNHLAPQLEELPGERLRMELEKALVESPSPSRYFQELLSIDALKYAYPELDALTDVPAGPREFHQEGNAYLHTMMVLEEMKQLRPNDETAMLMALAHDFGKAETPEEDLPNHPKHGQRGLDIIDSFQERLKFTNEQTKAMKEAARHHMKLHDIEELRDGTVLKMQQELDNTAILLDLMACDSRGRVPETEFKTGEAIRRLSLANVAVENISGEDLIEQGYSPEVMGGKDFGNLLHQRRVELMRELK